MRRVLVAVVMSACGSSTVAPSTPPPARVVAVPRDAASADAAPPDAAPRDVGAPRPTAVPNKWVAFASPETLYTAQFPSPPRAGHDRKQNPTFAVQDFASAYMIVSSVAPTGLAETLADEAAAGIRMQGGSISRTEKGGIPGWVVRDIWFRLEVRNDGVWWYGRQRSMVSVAAPFRIISAMALVGLPGDEVLADAFVANVLPN